MIQLWKAWFITLCKDSYFWIYYLILIILFIGNSLFQLQEQPAIIPFYGLLISLLTVNILKLEDDFSLTKLTKLYTMQPVKIAISKLLFSFLCSIPIITLLLSLLKRLFFFTPVKLLLICILLLVIFSITFSFACSILSSNITLTVIVIFYFTLFLMHGYQLEKIKFIAPTLNFMYPDFPNKLNILSILILSFIFFCVYLYKYYDWLLKERHMIMMMMISLSLFYLAIPYASHNLLKNMPKEQIYYDGLTINFEGLSKQHALRYAKVTTSVLQELQQNDIPAPIKEISIEWTNKIPKGESIENILLLKKDTLLIKPYSNKFLEFNYGYNIIEDIIDLFVIEKEVAKQIEQKIIQENKYNLFYTLY